MFANAVVLFGGLVILMNLLDHPLILLSQMSAYSLSSSFFETSKTEEWSGNYKFNSA